MRGTMMLAVMLAACGVDQAPPPSCAALGAPDTLLCSSTGTCSYQGQACTRTPGPTEVAVSSRLDDCGPAPTEPVLDSAVMTDSHGEQFVILSPEHWAADAAYIDAMHAWSRCIEYGDR